MSFSQNSLSRISLEAALKETGKIKFKHRNLNPEEEKIGEYFDAVIFYVCFLTNILVNWTSQFCWKIQNHRHL